MPSGEHGDGQALEITSVVGAQNSGLVAAFGIKPTHFAHPVVIAQAGAAFGELESDFFAVDEGDEVFAKLAERPVLARVLMVAENGDALFLESREERGGVAFAIKDEHEAVAERFCLKLLLGGLAGYFAQEAWDDLVFQDLLQTGVDGAGDAEEGGSIQGVDPVVSGGTEAEAFAADVASGEFSEVAVIDAGVAVDEQDACGLHVVFHPIAGERAGPACGAQRAVRSVSSARCPSLRRRVLTSGMRSRPMSLPHSPGA